MQTHMTLKDINDPSTTIWHKLEFIRHSKYLVSVLAKVLRSKGNVSEVVFT